MPMSNQSPCWYDPWSSAKSLIHAYMLTKSKWSLPERWKHTEFRICFISLNTTHDYVYVFFLLAIQSISDGFINCQAKAEPYLYSAVADVLLLMLPHIDVIRDIVSYLGATRTSANKNEAYQYNVFCWYLQTLTSFTVTLRHIWDTIRSS